MAKLKILVPVDGSEKSMHSIDWLKRFYSKDEAEVTVIMVVEVVYREEMAAVKKFEELEMKKAAVLEEAAKKLEGYTVTTESVAGHVADSILREAKQGRYDLIVITKSSVKGISRIIGSVTAKVVRDSEVAVVVLPE
jgi:nucleotide-binding universal stress UspA family protein